MGEFFAYVLELRLTLDKMQNTSPLMCTKFEFCCTHSSVYRVFWPSCRVSKNQYVAVNDPTTGPEHAIY